MKNEIAVYIPNYNNSEFLKEVTIPSGVDCIVMDNCSTDESETVCINRGFQFIRNTVCVDRVQNWIRCLMHFQNSLYTWMKWLFTGDILCENVMGIMREAVEKHPTEAVIIFDYNIVWPTKTGVKALNDNWEGTWSYKQLLDRMLLAGNVFGAPLGVMVSKNANFEKVHDNDFQWAADTYMHLQLCEGRSCAYVPRNIGSFIVPKRKKFSEENKSVFSTMEDIEVQRRALNLRKQYFHQAEDDYQSYILRRMSYCLENNVHGAAGILRLEKAVIRCIIKNNIRRRKKNENCGN